LTPREAEILALIAQGLSNQQIAERAYLSINSVKTYIRTAYRRIGVTSRSQAVLWAVDNGFRPETLRTIDPALLRRRSKSAAER
jgi:DNA-binding CsgD family transcriptional regulator